MGASIERPVDRVRRGGRQVAVVAHTVADGGQRRYWLAWVAEGTPRGRVLGRFPTSEEAIAATEQ